MNIRRVQWAGVEFQPDLKHPTEPVRLGLVINEVTKAGQGRVIVIGRLPNLDSPPKAFQSTSQTTMEIAAKWVPIMAKAAVDGSPDDLFARLAERWHWNLYLVEPVEITLTESTDLLRRAKILFREFVGEPFIAIPDPEQKVSAKLQKKNLVRRAQARIQVGKDVPHYTPGAWMINQIAPQLTAHR